MISKGLAHLHIYEDNNAHVQFQNQCYSHEIGFKNSFFNWDSALCPSNTTIRMREKGIRNFQKYAAETQQLDLFKHSKQVAMPCQAGQDRVADG